MFSWDIYTLVVIFFLKGHLQRAVNVIHEWVTKNVFKFAAHKCKAMHFTAPRSRVQIPPAIKIGNTFLPMKEPTKFIGLFWDSQLSFKKHISVLNTQRTSSEPYPSGWSLEVGRGQRHIFDAALGSCMLQAGLWLHCVWHRIECQSTRTGQHSQLWIETGIGSVLCLPNFQPVHRGQWNSFWETSVKAIHALLPENSCLR